MPLVTITTGRARRCRAMAKHSRQQCWNVAAHGMPVCRMHGARRASTVKRGADHPNYQHGEETQQQKSARSQELLECRRLEDELHRLGMTTAARIRGRKPKGASKP